MSYEKLFNKIVLREAPEGLLERTINRIHKERKQRARRRFFIFTISFIASIIAMVSAISTAKIAFTESGFMQFLSLIFSDFGIVTADWRNFGAIILESLPIASIAYLSVVLFWFLGSTKSLIKNIKIA